MTEGPRVRRVFHPELLEASPPTEPATGTAHPAPPGDARETAWREKFGRAAYEGFTRDLERTAQSAGTTNWRAWEALPLSSREAWANAARSVFVEATKDS